MRNLSDPPPVTAIFRLQMFKPSEPFIAAQAGALSRFTPVYLGRTLFGPPPRDAPCRPVQAHGAGTRPVICWNAVTRDPGIFAAALGGIRPALIHAHFGARRGVCFAARAAARRAAGHDVSRF